MSADTARMSMVITESRFKFHVLPACRYQICLFCYDRIKQDCGNLCPGCRTEYGTSKDPFAKLDVKRATEPASARTQQQRESGAAPKPPLHERQPQPQHRQRRDLRDAGGGSAKSGGGGAGHARGAAHQAPHQQNGVPPPPRQPPPPPPPRAPPPPVAQGPAVPRPGMSRSSSLESFNAVAAPATRQRPPPGWPAPSRGDPGNSPISSVGSGPLPLHIALERPSKVDAGTRESPPAGVAGATATEQVVSQHVAPWPSLIRHPQPAAPAQSQDQQQQSQQPLQQQRILDPQVPPPPMHRNQSAFSQWAPAHGGMRPDAPHGNHVLGSMPGFPAAPAFASPQQVLQAGTVQLATPLPLSGSGRAVLADPFGRSMLASLRLEVQTGRLTAEDAANQLAGYLRSRDVSSAALETAHGFAAPGSSGGFGEGSCGRYGHWPSNGQVQPLAPGPSLAPGASDAWPQWHAAAGAAGPQTVGAQAPSEPQPAKRTGRRPLYARGGSNNNEHEHAQVGGIGVLASNGNVAGAFAGLSLHASSFQPGVQMGGGLA